MLAAVHGQADLGPVSAGHRLVYYRASTSVPGSRWYAAWDPDCDPATHTCWVDDHGNTIREFDQPGAATHGYALKDILFNDGHTCVMRTTNMMIELLSGQPQITSVSGSATTGGTCEDYWMHPHLLAQTPLASTPTTIVVKGPFTIGGHVFEAMTIATRGGGSSIQHTYDAGSGLMVSFSARVHGAAAPVIDGGAIQPGAGNTLVVYQHLIGARAIDARAAAAPLPEHVRQVNGLSYACGTRLTTPWLAPYVPPVETPCEVHLQVAARGDSWLLLDGVRRSLHRTTGLTLEDSISDAVAAGATLGGYYACPALLQRLQPGMVLDIDPVTGYRMSVGRVDGTIVEVVEEGVVERITRGYDLRSGWLITFASERDMHGSLWAEYMQLSGVW